MLTKTACCGWLICTTRLFELEFIFVSDMYMLFIFSAFIGKKEDKKTKEVGSLVEYVPVVVCVSLSVGW